MRIALVLIALLSLVAWVACSGETPADHDSDQPEVGHNNEHEHAEAFHNLMKAGISVQGKMISNTMKAGQFDDEAYGIYVERSAKIIDLADQILKLAPHEMADKEDFKGWARDLKAAAEEIHAAATADPRDATGVGQGVTRLGLSCKNCHNTYRKDL